MDKHVRLLAIAHLVIAGLNLLVGLASLVFLAAIRDFLEVPPEAQFIRWLIWLAPLVLIFTSLPGFLAGLGLLNRARWARVLAMIVAVFHIPNVPLGTVLGIYTFWVLLDDDAATLFE